MQLATKLFALGSLILTAGAGQAFALSAPVTSLLNDVSTTCLASNATVATCRPKVTAYLAAVKAEDLECKQADDELAALVNSLAQKASTAPVGIRRTVSAILAEDVAGAFCEADRATLVSSIADDIASGNTVQTAAIAPRPVFTTTPGSSGTPNSGGSAQSFGSPE